MRRLIGFLFLFISVLAHAQTPVPLPITGNLGQLSGSPQPYAGVIIQLQNCASPVLVTGYWGIVAQTYQLRADASGLINSTVWANDQITCNGTTAANEYSMQWVVNGVPSGTPSCFQVVHTQGQWNINTQPPIPCTYTPPNPQDGNFVNLNSSGFFSGNNGSFSGTLLVGGLFTASGGINTTAFHIPSFTGGCAYFSPSGQLLEAAFGCLNGSFLPLTGGTLSGNLFGTNANFSAQVTAAQFNGPLNGLASSATYAVSAGSAGTAGSATTASALSGGLAQCPGGATGITADGDGNCIASTAGSGYQILSGGMIEQWVEGPPESANFSGPVTVSLPLPFPTACFLASTQLSTLVASSPTGNGSAYVNYAQSCTTTSVTVWMDVGPDSVGSATHNVLIRILGD